MSDNTPPIQPRPPTTGQTIGRSLIGPFKRHTDGTLDNAKLGLKQALKFLREHARDAEIPYSSEEIPRMKETVACLQQHLNNVRSLPQHFATKISIPQFQNDPKFDETVEEMKNYLKASEYERIIRESNYILAMFQQECHTHNIVLDELSQTENTPQDFDAFGDEFESKDKTPLVHQPISPNEIFDPNQSSDPVYVQQLRTKGQASSHPQTQSNLLPKPLLSNGVGYFNQPLPTFSFAPDSDISGIPTNIASTIPIQLDHHKLMLQRIEQLEKEKVENQSFERLLVERMEQMQTQYSRNQTGSGIPNFEQAAERQKCANKNKLYDETDAYSTEYGSDASHLSAKEPRYSRTTRHRRDKSRSRARPRGMSIDKVRENLIVFNGSGRLDIFRAIYDEFVTNNDRLTDRMKYILLEQHLTGQAAQFIQPLSDPVKSIRETFYELTQVFGDAEDSMALHDKFSSLPFHQSDWEKMTLDLAAHRSVINLLIDRGVNVNDERTIRDFVKKLPPKIQDEILLRLSDTKGLDFQDIHDITTKYIKFFKTKRSVVDEDKFKGYNEIDEIPHSILYTDIQAGPYNQNGRCPLSPPPRSVVNSPPIESNWTTSLHSNFSL